MSSPDRWSAIEIRNALHRAADLAADYLTSSSKYPVLPPAAPGDVRGALTAAPPLHPEPMDAILADYLRIIEPNVTHWNHPGFMAYFANTGSVPGVVGETLAAALNNNAMLWRTGPASVELEELTCDWLRQLVGLPAVFKGFISDTASTSSLVALGAAQDRAAPKARQDGLCQSTAASNPSGRSLRIYCSDQAHSSIDKSALMLGIGIANVVKVASDDQFRMLPQALSDAIAVDRRNGHAPAAVVATIGTTSSTSIDPVAALADICRRENLWLHVDAAYAGSAAICPELRDCFDGWDQADSIVVNPHKWLFVPVDCSVLWVRDEPGLRAAFSLVPEYLRTAAVGGTNLMDYGFQLGRRFRSLKLWMVLRAYGAQGLRALIRGHCELAREFAKWVRADPRFEVCAPTPFSVVCFRAVPPVPEARRDAINEQLMAAVNARGPFFISHTRLHGKLVLRAAIGNERTRHEHVAALWDAIRACHVEQ